MMNRRSFLLGLLATPVVVQAASLMQLRGERLLGTPLWLPPNRIWTRSYEVIVGNAAGWPLSNEIKTYPGMRSDIAYNHETRNGSLVAETWMGWHPELEKWSAGRIPQPVAEFHGVGVDFFTLKKSPAIEYNSDT